MSNPLENFTLMDLVDLKERAIIESVNKQASDIIDAIYKSFLVDHRSKYVEYCEEIHFKNIEHLCENGFNVWRISSVLDGLRVYRYFICWDVDDFEREIFERYKSDGFNEYVEIVPAPHRCGEKI